MLTSTEQQNFVSEAPKVGHTCLALRPVQLQCVSENANPYTAVLQKHTFPLSVQSEAPSLRMTGHTAGATAPNMVQMVA